MSWIDNEIETIRKEQMERVAAREWTLRKGEILRGKLFLVWSAVSAQVRKDVAALEAVYKGEVEFTEAPARTFTVKKKTTPCVSVTASIRTDCRMIDLMIRQGNSFGFVDDKPDAIGVDMDEKENVRYFWFDKSLNSLEDVSRIILSPVLAAFRH